MGTASAGYIQAGELVGPAMAHGAQWTFLVFSGFGLAALVAAFFLPRKGDATGSPVAAT